MKRTGSRLSILERIRPVWYVILVLLIVSVLAGCGASVATRPAAKKTDPNVVTAAQLTAELEKLKSSGANADALTALRIAIAELGKKYEWGGNGPDSWDCSALVRHAYASVGVDLPRVTYDQVNTGRAVNLPEIAPGDMVFFRGNSHVGLYVGDGIFVHAYPPSVRVERLARYQGQISAVRRVI
jgi:peptidoglycan DL-endopeptidase CwlO